MIRILREQTWWVMRNGEEELCWAANVSFDEALDAFAANYPEYVDELDAMKCDDFCGTNGVKQKVERQAGQRKRDSGARFRELILQGKSNQECLDIVRAEFPESRATLSDAAWNRAQIKKNPSGIAPDGRKVYLRQNTRETF